MEKDYYDKTKDWCFDEFQIEEEGLTDWNLYEILNKITNENSKILDLGTGGGEKLLKFFPECKEILGTDFSEEMINTANKNLILSKRKNIKFKVMNNLKMDVPLNYYDVVVARNTITDPKQIYKCLKTSGYLLLHGVDKYDCWSLKLMFGKGQAFHDIKPISIIDYENVINAGFKDIELIPIFKREYIKNKELFKLFLEKVPIIKNFSEENNEGIDDTILDNYINENTEKGKIKLLRRYYGIIAKK